MIPEKLALAMIDDGWCIRNKIVWSALNRLPSSAPDRFRPMYEMVYLLAKRNEKGDCADYYFNLEAIKIPYKGVINREQDSLFNDIYIKKDQTSVIPGDIWNINTEPLVGESHRASFPTKLIDIPILSSTREGDIVLDPFFGSGTVGLCCERAGRKWIGFELNEVYCDIIKRRVGKEANQRKLI